MASEIAMLVRSWGFGTSIQLSLGGSPIVGTSLTEGVRLVEEDPRTKVTVVFGEPSGQQENELARAIVEGTVRGPVIALVAGRAADMLPETLTFGHAPRAGTSGIASVSAKVAELRTAGCLTVDDTTGLLAELRSVLGTPNIRH